MSHVLLIEPWDLLWLGNRLGLKRDGRARKVLYLRHSLGFSPRAIAAELHCSEITVRTTLCRFWRRVRRREWSREEEGYIQAIIGASDAARSRELLEEAHTLYLCLRGKRSGSPPTPTYDELGRLVGAHAQLITVGDIHRLLMIRKYRAEVGAEAGNTERGDEDGTR